MAEDFLVDPDSGPARYRVQSILLDWDQKRILIWLLTPAGKSEQFTYTGDEAKQLMVALNKANLTANSLHRRILERLRQDQKLPAGQITGTPD